MSFFGEADIGVLMEYDITSFSLNMQDVGGENVDLGTFVDGYSAFVTPTIFYSFSGRDIGGKHDQALITGVGFGLAYLHASGDISIY